MNRNMKRPKVKFKVMCIEDRSYDVRFKTYTNKKIVGITKGRIYTVIAIRTFGGKYLDTSDLHHPDAHYVLQGITLFYFHTRFKVLTDKNIKVL